MDTRVVVFLALAATALAGPISNDGIDTCSTRCTDSTKLRYAPGTTYTYDYRVDTSTSMAGASEDTARLTLQTIGDIEVLSSCELSLQLRNTKLFHTDGNGNMKTADREVQFRSKLEAYPLRFSYQDGKVAHVCPVSGDDAKTMNLKKGFLSAFQNSMDDLSHSQNVTETDVTGTCKTEYTLVNNGYYAITLKKTKDILSCTDRHNFETMVQTTPYLIPSDIQSLPLMKTTHECEQSLEIGGVLKSTVCSETHVYRPFANGVSGGSTTVTQKLTYQTYRKSSGARKGSVGHRDTLIFDHSVTQPTRDQARLSVVQKLSEICETTLHDIRPESPRLFSELVVAMKSMDADDMEEIYRLLKKQTLCPSNGRTYKFFLDALPMTNTRNSVRLMSKLIDKKDVKGLQAKAWLTALAFIPQPTTEMIMDVKDLIDNKKVREDALLPVTSLINNFCRQRDSCDRDNAVLSIIKSLERTIGYRCDATGKDFEEILLTLRAIGNAGHTSRAVNILNTCMTVTSNPMEIRVAATEAFRRMPCTGEDQNLWDLFMDKSLDSELRISTYQALMRCPSEKSVGKIASILFTEDNDQVGAFVYSHLTNLKESSNPHKQDVARIINNLALDKEFDMNPLKFSRNYEISTLINKLNTGFTAESNMIWSSSDQLPRSVAGNLTVELFGQSVNVFDFGGRLEGLEYLLRNVLGPYVNSDDKKDAQIDFKKIHGSMFGRIFGNEMLFIHSQTTKSPFGNMPSKWLDVIIKLAKKQEFSFTQNFQFIDASMVIPTAAGLPVQIHVNGTAIVDLSISGKMDLRKVGASPRSMDVDGEVNPSAALEVTGTMAVDAFVTKTGLRMRNTLHSSTSVKGRIQLERGQQLNIEFDTPKDKIEIFGAKSQFFILHNDIEQEQEMIKENKKEFEMCSGTTSAAITGMELCGQLTFPNASHKFEGPYFPLTGPTTVSVTLFKRDTHSGYKLFAKRIGNKKANIAQFIVNTPGSKVDRAITLDLTLNYAKQVIEMNMFSPWKKLEIKGNVINQDGMKSVAGNVVIDNANVYSMTSEMKTTQEKRKIQYSPMIELRRPGVDDVQLIGSIALERRMKSVDVDMSLVGIQKFPYTFKSTIINTKKDKILRASISTDDKNVYSVEASNKLSIMGKKSISASVKTKFGINTPTMQLVSISSTGDYRQDKSLKFHSTVAIHRLLKRPASLKVNLVKIAKIKGSRYDLDVFLKSSPVTARIDSNTFVKESGFMSTKISLDYSIPKVDKNKIVFSGKFNDRSTRAYTKFSVRSILDVKKNPDYNVGMVLDVDHKKKHSEVELNLKYGPNPKDKTKKIYFLASLSRKITNLRNALVNYKIKTQAPEHEIDVFLGGKHVHTPKMLDSSIQLKYRKNENVKAALILRDLSAKLTKLNGKMNVEWPGTQYVVNSQLVQRSAKQYSHVLSVKCNDDAKHSISTIYKISKAGTHDISTALSLHGVEPVLLTGSTTLKLRNFAVSGKVIMRKDVYGLVAKSRFTKAPTATVSLELIHPGRRMTLDVSGGKSKSKYEGSVVAAWDADNKNSKVVLDGAYLQKSSKGDVSIGGNVNFRSPFTHFEDLLASFKYGSDPSEHNIDSKLSWGGKGKQITSSMNIKKDLSLRNIDITVGFKTPFRGFRNAEVSIEYNLGDSLNCVLKGNWEKENMKLVFQGQDLSDNHKTELKGNLALKSSLKNAKAVTATFSHSLNNGKLLLSADVNDNGQKYHIDINVAHTGNGWQFKNNGDVTVKAPKQKLTSKWAYKNTDKAMTFSLTSICNKETLKVDFSGFHELSDLRKLNTNLQIRSPWMIARTVEITFDHKHGNGLIESKTLMKRNGETDLSSLVTFIGDETATVVEFELNTPINEDISGKFNAQYDKYPMTLFAELSWAPKTKASIEGSLNVASWDSGDINVKLTTPYHKYRNILFEATIKKVDDELITHLFLDYGVRQSIGFESRLGYGSEQKSVRVKVTSPFDSIKSLDTGLTFNGNLHKFDSRADFELMPTLGKFDTVVSWQYENGMNGKIRLNTPFQEYPYFEFSTSSILKSSSVRRSRIQLEYYPHKTSSLDCAYGFELPLSFEATFRSPYPKYDNLGISIKHNFANSIVHTHGEVRYRPNAMIEADLNADWSADIDGSLVVKTPFQNFESNHISLRHKERKQLFSSNAEVSLAQEKFAVDVSLKTGHTTSGAFSFTSPLPAMKIIKVSLKKRGTIENLKGGVVLTVNEDNAEANFNNKVSSSSVKSGLAISTPYTETFKLSLDHKGLLNNFANKMSLNYGRKVDIDTVTSFNFHQSDLTAKTMLKYKLGKGRKTAKLTVTKSGPIENMSISGTASFNRDDISIKGSWKSENGFDGTVVINTPFKNFKATGMTLSHKGDMNNFQSNAKINYMDDKSIYGNLELFNQDGCKFRLVSQLSTPFTNLKTSSLEVTNEMNKISKQIDGSISLTTSFRRFGTANLTYTKSGDLTNLFVDSRVFKHGIEFASLGISNNIKEKELHSKFDLKSVVTPVIFFSIDHSGDNSSFNTKAVTTVGKTTLSSQANMKRGLQSVDADGLILYKSGDLVEKKYSINVHTYGLWDKCDLRVSGKLNDDKVKLSVSRQGQIQDFNFNGMASYNAKAININGSWKTEGEISGKIDIQTPLDNFHNVGLSLSYAGDGSTFSSNAILNYMDDRKISGSVNLTANSAEEIQFSTHLSTPFENYRYIDVKFNNAYNTHTTDVSGNIALSTPIAHIGTKSIRYSKTGVLNNLKIDVIATENGIDGYSLKVLNTFDGKDLHAMLGFKTNPFQELLLAVDHTGDLDNLKTIAMGTFGKDNVIKGEATLNIRNSTIDGDWKFMYNIVTLGRNNGSLKIHKEGEKEDLTVEVILDARNKLSKLNFNFKNTDERRVSLVLNTPIENFKHVGFSIKHNGNLERCNCEGKIELMDNMILTGKMDFYRYLFQRIETVIEVTTPFKGIEFTKYEYRHEGEQDHFKCSSALQYSDSRKIVSDLTASISPYPLFTLNVKTPSNSLSSSGYVEYTWPKYVVKGSFDEQDGRVVTFDGVLDFETDGTTGSFKLSTPIKRFTDVGLAFSSHLKRKGFEYSGHITFMDNKTISAKAAMDFEMRTTFTKYENVNIMNERLMKATTKHVYGNDKNIVNEVYSTWMSKQEFVVSLKTPFENYEDLMAYASFDYNSPKYNFTSKVNAGNEKVYSLTGSFDMSEDIAGALNIATPHEGFTDIGMDFLHSGNVEKFGTEGKITYVDGKDISGKLNFYKYLWRRIIASTELSTPFSGLENTKAEINFEDNSNSISTTGVVENGAGEKLNGNLKWTYTPNYDIMVTLNTPIDDYKIIRAQGSLDVTSPSYEVTYRVDGGHNQVYSATGKLNWYSFDSIDASLEMNTPLSGFEYAKSEYRHKIDATEIDGYVSLMYMNEKKISAELKTTLNPHFDTTISVKTPFSGLEYMQGSATFEQSHNRFETSSSLNLGSRQMYSMSSDIDYSSFPLRASTRMSTPYTDFRSIELTLTHDGELNNFASTALFISPLTKDINAKATFKYDSILNLAATASLQSSLSGFDDLRTEVKMSSIADERKMHLLMGWTEGQEVAIDSVCRLQQDWYGKKLYTDLTVLTPFTAVGSLAWQMETAEKDGSLSHKMGLDLNGDSLLDFDSDLKYKDKPEIHISIRQPWSMLYTGSMSRDTETASANVFLNWNRNEPDSNIRLQTTMTDKSNDYQTENTFDLTVNHASREVGLVHKINIDSTQTASNGHIYWGADDSKVFYDLQINNNSRRRKQIIDGSFKLGLPTRNIVLIGSYSDNKVVKAADVSFSWDVDRDVSKRVGLKATMNRGDGIRGDIALSLPSLRKEIRVDGEVMLKNGRIVFDTKTDFSYSRDSRKTLTLTSKLDDISDYYHNFNYSLSLGVSHPYTNLNLEIDSHVGSSDELTTFGMNTAYLTAKRQIKHLALLTEINKLKKKINLQVASPTKLIEIAGNVLSTSPYKVRIVNKVNDIETFRSDMTIDQNKNSILLNAFMDSEGVTVSAKYPNSTAFQADVTHHTLDQEHREGLLAVRLNTSRLLHTRLSWRPEVMDELRVILLENAVVNALSAKAALSEMNEAIGDELSAKYIAITDEFTRELGPFINSLNEELSSAAVKMSEVSKELRAMYDRNDFYVQDMGVEINEYYTILQEKLTKLTHTYKSKYQELIQAMTQYLRNLRRYPIRKEYTKMVEDNAQWIKDQVSQSLTWVESVMDELDKSLRQYKAKASQVKKRALDTVYNVTYVDYLSNKLGQIQNNINLRPSSFKLPEEYTNAIYDAHSTLYTSVADFLDKSQAKYLKDGANEVYQQGMWAYHYWQMEENIRKHTHSILQTLKGIIKDELKEVSKELQFLVNPIAVWDPDHGEIQADLPLPIAVKKLNQAPDFSPLVQKVEQMTALYLPDHTTWNKFIQAVSNEWQLGEVSQKDKKISAKVKKERPVKKHRRRGRKLKFRYAGQ